MTPARTSSSNKGHARENPAPGIGSPLSPPQPLQMHDLFAEAERRSLSTAFGGALGPIRETCVQAVKSDVVQMTSETATVHRFSVCLVVPQQLLESWEGRPRSWSSVQELALQLETQVGGPDAPALAGAAEFHARLLAAGAQERFITKQWVENHYRWIVWKLAAYERRDPGNLAGKALTAENVLEQLKYR